MKLKSACLDRRDASLLEKPKSTQIYEVGAVAMVTPSLPLPWWIPSAAVNRKCEQSRWIMVMLQARCMMGTMSAEDEDEEDYGNKEAFDLVS